jgi:hypothetical protein
VKTISLFTVASGLLSHVPPGQVDVTPDCLARKQDLSPASAWIAGRTLGITIPVTAAESSVPDITRGRISS